MKLNHKYAEEWLNQLKEHWFKKDIEKATSLFIKTSFYQETPFDEPYTVFKDIVQEWQHIKNQNIKFIDFKILAIDNNVLIINWIFDNNNDYFDGIYEIKFNDRLECVYFKSWEMKKQ